MEAITSDATLRDVPLDAEAPLTKLPPYQMNDPQGRVEAFKMLLTNASIELTSTMLIADEAEYFPITDDRPLTQLLAMRASHPAYVGGIAAMAPYLGLEIAKAVIPDEALQALDVRSILQYREATADVYAAWNVELNKIAASMDAIDPTAVQTELPRVMATEIAPKMQEYRNEMKAVADRMFGDVIKRIVSWQVPALLLGNLAHLNLIQAVATFAAALAPAVTPAVVDYVTARTHAKRKHAISFLVDLAQR